MRVRNRTPLWVCCAGAVALWAPGASPAHLPGALVGVWATNGDTPFSGDGRLLTTISPNGDGFRDAAQIHVRLREAARVRLEIAETSLTPVPVYRRTVSLRAGTHVLTWTPRRTIPPRTYLVLLRVDGAVYGATTAQSQWNPTTPTIRVQGLDAALTRESYRPGDTARLVVATDAPSFQLQIFSLGHELVRTRHDSEMHGVPLTTSRTVDWTGHRSQRASLDVPVGDWPSGVYYVQLTDDTGRVGYAPLVVRPARLGEHRVAVILPSNTWQAYNWEDEDGNGWGDTWYAGLVVRRARLGRHYQGWGMPPVFRRYDLPFLRWLENRERAVDYLSDGDLDRVRDAAAFARAYDFVIFEGHEEYVTGREHTLIRAFRDSGGNLAFLSADNLDWRIVVRGRSIERTAKWRALGRPPSELVGTEYIGFARVAHPYVARRVEAIRWLFAGTGIRNGSRFLRGGIEADAVNAQSPRGVVVVAEIPDVFGSGRTAQMTYYRTARGAKVFAAGAFTIAGSAMTPLGGKLLDNLWNGMRGD
jgi:hypothetical protein